MHCNNCMPKALRPGDEKGAVVLIGAKAPIVEGALLSSVLIPFLNIDDEEEFGEFCDLVEEMQDVWCEEGKNRERVGEFIQRVGMGNFLEAVGVEPIPEMVAYPRDNPYIFFEHNEEDEEE
jgi:sulfite reductase alpha subunit